MKYIYLDQFHWINLAKAACGRPDGKPYVEVLNRLVHATRDGIALCPLSSAHIMETAKSPKPEQRELLANLMTGLSKGVVIRWPKELVESQIRNALRRIFDETPIDDQLFPFGRGALEAFTPDFWKHCGITEDHAARLRMIMDSPTALIGLLSYRNEAQRVAGITTMKNHGGRSVAGLEQNRLILGDAPLNEVRQYYAATLWLEFYGHIERCLAEIGRSTKDWGAKGPIALTEFWADIPTLNIEMELHCQMHKMKSRRWDKNDNMDISSLASAIPVCDYVFTERFWIGLYRKRSLHSKFKATLSSELNDLIKLI